MRTRLKAQCAALALLAIAGVTTQAAETLNVVTFGGAFEAAAIALATVIGAVTPAGGVSTPRT